MKKKFLRLIDRAKNFLQVDIFIDQHIYPHAKRKKLLFRDGESNPGRDGTTWMKASNANHYTTSEIYYKALLAIIIYKVNVYTNSSNSS